MEKEELEKMLHFLKDKFEDKWKEEYCYYHDRAQEDYNRTVREELDAESVENGASKLVLYFSEFPNYVFKIPFIGISDNYSIVYDEEEEDCDYYYSNFYNDYCEKEYEVYQEAIEAGVSDFLARIDFLGIIDDFSIYVSEKINNSVSNLDFSNDTSKSRSKSLANSLSKNYGGYFMDSYCMALLIDQYGITRVKKLLDFFDCCGVDDFHIGNFKSTDDGRIKIIDFSGFDE